MKGGIPWLAIIPWRSLLSRRPLIFVSSTLYQIASFLLDVVGGLLTGACLLRLYMQWQRVPFSNPVGGLVFALTDWLIMPLRRGIPPVGRWDVSNLVAAVLLQLAQYFLLTLLLGAASAWAWVSWLAEDSRHEMNLGSYEGILLGGDVLSDPPGVPIIIPGNWNDSPLRGRLRDNRMPPGWEFDIEETNLDGPLLEHDGGNVYAVELIGAWVEAGAPDGTFTWTDTTGSEHSGSFEADVLPVFTTEDAWFEGSQACTECHFDNSEGSRHEMNLGSHEGILLGADVLSDPPGVPIVLPGDWENSKLRARLRNNRMPPGWEFDIEETNRDGPLIRAGYLTGGLEPQPVSAATAVAPAAPVETVSTIDEADTSPSQPEIPQATITWRR